MILLIKIRAIFSFCCLGCCSYFSRSKTATFFPRVLKQTPLSCSTVIVICPVLLVLISLTIPDLPIWVPPMTIHLFPSFNFWVEFAFIFLFLKCVRPACGCSHTMTGNVGAYGVADLGKLVKCARWQAWPVASIPLAIGSYEDKCLNDNALDHVVLAAGPYCFLAESAGLVAPGSFALIESIWIWFAFASGHLFLIHN